MQVAAKAAGNSICGTGNDHKKEREHRSFFCGKEREVAFSANDNVSVSFQSSFRKEG
ncbi:MAG: hypothetical protein MZV70_41425 [Desulfobacterales bacterium]|nr:hypothetical protein [Desulfobacterales bacterium]